MDVDNVSYLNFFDCPPESFPWTEQRVEEIQHRRAAMSDSLLFDILLSLGGIPEPDTLFPPIDADSLRRLLQAIGNSRYDELKKECLVYMLLKAYPDGRAEVFREKRSVLPQFCSLAEAYWLLDSGLNIPRAISLLSDSRLNRDYSSKILQAINTTANPFPLILRYIRTAKPVLVEPEDIELYTIALAESSLLEAWQYQRSLNEKDALRPRLINRVLEWSVTPTPRPTPLQQLLALPLSSYETSRLNSFLLEPPKTLSTSGLAILQNLACVRLIQGGKYAEAIKMDRQLSSESPLKDSRERTDMIQSLYSALSSTERSLLDIELDARTSRHPVSSRTVTNSQHSIGDASISQSWVDIGPFIPSSSTVSLTNSLRESTSRKPRRSFNPNGPSTPLFANPPSSSLPQGARATPLPSSTPTVPVSSVAIPVRPAPVAPSMAETRNNQDSFLFKNTDRPTATNTPSANFTSAAKRQNAFFRPPASNGATQAVGTSVFVRQARTPSPPIVLDEDSEMVGLEDEADKGVGLGFSVFGGAPPPGKLMEVPDPEPAAAPPGGLSMDIEDDLSAPREYVFRSPSPPRRTRSKKTDNQPKDTASRKSQLKSVEQLDFKRSIPGSFMEDDHVDDDEQEEDELAPLPPPTRTRGTRRATRAASSDLASEDGGDENRPRRRSSRLSTVPVEPKKKGVDSKTKRGSSGKGAGSKKKRV